MNTAPIDVDELECWIRSKEPELKIRDIELADVRKRYGQTSAIVADFDSVQAVGRITAWTTGEIDFEVLRRSTGEDLFFQHESVPSINTMELQQAYDVFIDKMLLL